MKWIMSVCAVVIFSLSFPLLTSAQTKGDANAGKAKYESLCAGCHGKAGKGDGPAAASLNPKPQDHTDGKVMNSLSDQYLSDIIKNGGAGVKKSPLMPAWGKTLKDQEISDVIAYIRSLANPPYKAGK
jgi:mono/diheme cytochrome c family protein